MKNFFMTATKYLQGKLPLKNDDIKHCRCLNSTNRKEPWAVGSVKMLAEKLPHSLNVDVDVLCDECRQYQLKESVDSFMKDPGGTVRWVDHY